MAKSINALHPAMTRNGSAFNYPDGVVFKINDRGQAVGATGTGYQPVLPYLNGLHATLWQNGSLIDLGNLGGIAPFRWHPTGQQWIRTR